MTVRKAPSYKKGVYAVVLIGALAVVFYFFLLPLMRKKATFHARLEELKHEVAAEQELHRKLRREQRLLEEQDPTYLEKYARDNFGWAREGETVYRLEK